jgi:hypothetical protein
VREIRATGAACRSVLCSHPTPLSGGLVACALRCAGVLHPCDTRGLLARSLCFVYRRNVHSLSRSLKSRSSSSSRAVRTPVVCIFVVSVRCLLSYLVVISPVGCLSSSLLFVVWYHLPLLDVMAAAPFTPLSALRGLVNGVSERASGRGSACLHPLVLCSCVLASHRSSPYLRAICSSSPHHSGQDQGPEQELEEAGDQVQGSLQPLPVHPLHRG